MNAQIDPPTAVRLRATARPDGRTLEIGCGPAQYRDVMRGRYVGTDITAPNGRSDRQRGPDLLSDAHAVPFADAVFDLVFYVNTFHLLGDPAQAIREARRVLRTGGSVRIFDYTRSTLRYLADRYAAGGMGPTVVQECSAWRALLGGADWTHVDVRLNSLSPLTNAARVLLPRGIYERLVDSRAGSIVISAIAA